MTGQKSSPSRLPVTIAVPHLGDFALLRSCLNQLLETDYPTFSIRVIDLATTDGSVDLMAREFPEVAVLRHSGKGGLAGAWNAVLADTVTEFAAFVNPAVAVPSGWLAPLVDLAEARQGLTMVQPKILSASVPGTFACVGGAGGYLDYLGTPTVRGHLFSHPERDTGQYQRAQPILWASSACCLFRTSHWEQVGPFDLRFDDTLEDLDYCWRAQQRGHLIGYQGEAAVTYDRRRDPFRQPGDGCRFELANLLTFLGKHFPLHQFSKGYAAQVAKEGAASVGELGSFRVPGWDLANGLLCFWTDTVVEGFPREEATGPGTLTFKHLEKRLIQTSVSTAYYLKGVRTFQESWQPPGLPEGFST